MLSLTLVDDGLLRSAAVLFRLLSLLLLLTSDDDFFRENRNDPSDRNSFLFFIIAVVGRGATSWILQHYHTTSLCGSFCNSAWLIFGESYRYSSVTVRVWILVGVVIGHLLGYYLKERAFSSLHLHYLIMKVMEMGVLCWRMVITWQNEVVTNYDTPNLKPLKKWK